jgi:hypothetical protein
MTTGIPNRPASMATPAAPNTTFAAVLAAGPNRCNNRATPYASASKLHAKAMTIAAEMIGRILASCANSGLDANWGYALFFPISVVFSSECVIGSLMTALDMPTSAGAHPAKRDVVVHAHSVAKAAPQRSPARSACHHRSHPRRLKRWNSGRAITPVNSSVIGRTMRPNTPNNTLTMTRAAMRDIRTRFMANRTSVRNSDDPGVIGS